jgi:hypothetical protein
MFLSQCSEATTDEAGLFALGADTALLMPSGAYQVAIATVHIIINGIAACYIEESLFRNHGAILSQIAWKSSHYRQDRSAASIHAFTVTGVGFWRSGGSLSCSPMGQLQRGQYLDLSNASRTTSLQWEQK